MQRLFEDKIFKHLFSLEKYSDDQEGVVCACLVDGNGKILASGPSFQDGRHAEYVVLQKIKEIGIQINKNHILYTTLEPCCKRTNQKYKDCTTEIISSGIKTVVYAALDPEYSQETPHRFREAKIKYLQVKNKEIIEKSTKLFNSTTKVPLAKMELKRKNLL